MHSKPQVIDIIKGAIKEGRESLNVYESKLLINCCGISITEMQLANNEDEAVEIASKIGFPVAMKIVSPDIIHKTDVGGVILDIYSAEEARNAFLKIVKNIKKRIPSARIKGVLVEEMVKDGYEVIIGGIRDPQFGPTLMFGLGGIFVEVFKDVTFGIAPISDDDADDLIRGTKAYRILLGYRGKPKADIASLKEMLMKASEVLWKYRRYIKEMDLNPVFVMEEGKGCKVADARIILEEKDLSNIEE